MDEVNNTQDIKAATDLQNRISVEQAKIANNQTKLDMLDRLYKRQQESNSASMLPVKNVWHVISVIATMRSAISSSFIVLHSGVSECSTK